MNRQVDACTEGLTKDQRVALWDNVMLVWITMTVVGRCIEHYVGISHLFKALFLFIYSFHMPLCFFVMGLSHKNERIKEKTLGYLSIYIVFKAVIALTLAACGKDFSISLLEEIGAPWFMLAMAFFVCATYCLRNIDPQAVLLLAVVVACCAGYDKSIGDILAASRSIVFFPFYYAGTVLPKEKMEQLAARRNWKIIGLVVLLAWFAICYLQIDAVYTLRPFFTGRNSYDDTVRNIGWIIRLGCYMLTTMIGMGVILAVPTGKMRGMKRLTAIGTRTLQIYFWHIPIHYILRYTGCLGKLIAMGAPGRILLLLAAPGVVLLCSLKPFEQPTAYLMKAFAERTQDRLSGEGVRSTDMLKNKIERYHFLFEELVKRDFKKKYKRTVLGMAWSMISPLMTLLVMKIVFTQFFGRSTPHYTTYLFCGNLVFAYFNESTSQGMQSLMGNASIFTKAMVPKYLFLLSKNVQTFINFLLTLCIFFIFCVFDGITFTWKFALLLYPICMLILFNIGMGLILSALYVFFRDIQYLWSIFTQLLMYLSVIFYTIDRYSEVAQRRFLANPIYLFIRYFREIVIDGIIPSTELHLLIAFDVAVALGLGCWIYKRYNTEFLYHV